MAAVRRYLAPAATTFRYCYAGGAESLYVVLYCPVSEHEVRGQCMKYGGV